MAKPRLLYASPFPPRRSGVSAYSQWLVQGLKEHFQITLLLDDDTLAGPDLLHDFQRLTYRAGPVDFTSYDHVLYNVGNNRHFHAYIYDAFLNYPAPVILHDVILYYLAVGYYQDSPLFYSRLYDLGGAAAVSTVKDCRKTGQDPLTFARPQELALNREIILQAPLIFVHSRDAMDRVMNAGARDVRQIAMVDMGKGVESPTPGASPPASSSYLADRFGIPDHALVLASLGFIAPTKQNQTVCRALPLLQQLTPRTLYYVMAGEGNHADEYLSDRIVKTGYLATPAYEAVLERCDLVANLRQPSMGETSMSLVQAMSAGKPCLVSDLAWFAELPDDAVIKIPHRDPEAEIPAVLAPYLQGRKDLSRVGDNARAYVREHHNLSRIAADIARALLESRGPAERP
jgi:glycosyltransferase involved in cell wall biosynthesis